MAGKLVSLDTTPDVTQRLLELLAFLLCDVDTDICVAARDLGIADASFLRLQRALDRLACARRLVETLSTVKDRAADGQSQAGGDAERELGAISRAGREAVELLARKWPEDYAAGAVEWLSLRLSPCSKALEHSNHVM